MDEDRPLSIFPPLHVAGGRDEWFDNHHCRGIVRLANFLTVVMRTSVIVNRRVSLDGINFSGDGSRIYFFYYKVIREGDYKMLMLCFISRFIR